MGNDPDERFVGSEGSIIRNSPSEELHGSDLRHKVDDLPFIIAEIIKKG